MAANNKIGKDATTSKRSRVNLACNRCRERKTKCDGGKPCATCAKRNAGCVYGTKYARANVTVEYVRELEERLGIASTQSIMPPSISNTISSERGYSMQQNLNGSIPPPLQGSTYQHRRQESVANATQSEATGVTPSSSINTTNSTSSVFRSSKDSTSAMGAGDMAKHKGKDRDYYGSSAAISFMNNLSSIIDKSDTENDETETFYKMSRSDPMTTVAVADLELPPRALADLCVQNYFEFAYTLYPFVHKPTFMATYNSLWGDEESGVDELFYSIVNVIFAFGCQLAPAFQNMEDNSDIYFERSQRYLRFHLMDSGSVLLVQALLLNGQFLQASSGSAGCWNIVGLAIRIAQGLGLHQDQNYASTKSLIEREIRKRLWQGCLLMDRIVSMTLGRPMMVVQNSEQGEVPLCLDDEYIKDEEVLLMDVPSKLDFFAQTIKLYNILADILNSVYPNDQLDNNPQILLDIFKFEHRLHNFEANLPNHLHFSAELQKMVPFARQSIVLHIRVLHLKILLYRPVLFPKKSNTFEVKGSELYTSSQRSVALHCITLAMEFLEVISKYRAGDIVYLPAHWYNVFYIYSIGTVLLAANLQVTLHKDMDMVAFERAWSLCLEMLRSYTQQSESASRCLEVLEMMGNKVQISSRRLATQANTPSNDVITLRESEMHYSPGSTSPEVPTDVLYSLLYDTAGPFGGPFHFADDIAAFHLR
ncbi:hypothetical protein KGF57_004869 [Candida theae]|uniref:Zn(2)-C6 fungal-type domain-containing protein n=1 Tax=Candida theae TaxID=1198502 RepID=A0AAD5FWM6_9ASCO|nr:uncharacterized protein KGF57_004869 [Candida theae]KAI5949270.1 hypothetical protein KGF57_004869 [Candida theae]